MALDAMLYVYLYTQIEREKKGRRERGGDQHWECWFAELSLGRHLESIESRAKTGACQIPYM
jgi:hypothetical protein